MSKSLFDLGCKGRLVSNANHMMYKTGIVHPERIMDEHDFIYMVDGEWDIIQNGKTYKMKKNDVLILNAHENHSGKVPCLPDTHTIFFHVSDSKNDNFIEGEIESDIKLKEECLYLPTFISCERFPGIKQCFEKIVSARGSKANEKYKDYRLSYLFSLLLLDLEECVRKTPSVGSIAEEAAKLIRSNPHLFFREKELSYKLHISEKGLRCAFKKIYGLTPYKYQLSFKLEMACIYLENHSQMKLSEIANNLGFYDEFHFSRHFKAVYGISPGSWRAARKQNT